jgi:hypothetical protein
MLQLKNSRKLMKERSRMEFLSFKIESYSRFNLEPFMIKYFASHIIIKFTDMEVSFRTQSKDGHKKIKP